MNTGQDGFFGSLAGVCGRRLHAVYPGQEPLHPVFGPGEDRNWRDDMATACPVNELPLRSCRPPMRPTPHG